MGCGQQFGWLVESEIIANQSLERLDLCRFLRDRQENLGLVGTFSGTTYSHSAAVLKSQNKVVALTCLRAY